MQARARTTRQRTGAVATALVLVLSGIGLAVAPTAFAADPVPVASWGANGSGQLGNATVVASTAPVAVVTTGALAGKTVVQVSAGAVHACAVTSDGLLACWGENGSGQVGVGTTTDSTIPVQVGGLLAGKTVTAVSAGNVTTCAVASGAVYCWGSGTSGALGNGLTVGSTVPVEVFAGGVLAGKTVTAVATGSRFACAVAGGQVYCWGGNGFGQLGDTTRTDRTVPVAVYVGALPFPGFLYGKTVTQLSASNYHACARTDGGGLACWGLNVHSQLGVPTGASCGTPCALTPQPLTDTGVPGSGFLAGRTVAQVSAGLQSTCAATTDGAATCWGDNLYGQLGDTSVDDRPTPVPVYAGPGGMLAGKTVTGVAVGWFHACARGSDGSLACWGRNSAGQLGGTSVTICSGNPCNTVPLSVAAGGGGPGAGVLAGGSVLAASGGEAFTLAVTATVPAAPTGVTATAGDTKATVTWTAPPATGGSPITSYSVQKSTDSGVTWSAATAAPVAAPATTVEVPGLVNGTPVSFRVAAINMVGTGPYSTPSVPVTPAVAVTVPGAPTGVTATAGTGSVALTWTPPASTGGAPITSYQVQQSADSGATWLPSAGSPVAVPATGLTVTGLTAGVPVVFRVAAVNSVGPGPWSATTTPVTPLSARPGPVTNLQAVSRARGKATVSWQPPAVGGTLIGYKWRIKKGKGSFSSWRSLTSSTLRVRLTGLTPGARYTIGVLAYNAAGNGRGTPVSVWVRR